MRKSAIARRSVSMKGWMLAAAALPAFALAMPSARISIRSLEVPLYPAIARNAAVQGEIRVALRLLPDGSVSEVNVVSGHPLLRHAAVESVKKWRFACSDCDSDKPFEHEFVIAFYLGRLEEAQYKEWWERSLALRCRAGGKKTVEVKQECEKLHLRMSNKCPERQARVTLVNSSRMELDVSPACPFSPNIGTLDPRPRTIPSRLVFGPVP